MYTLELTDNKSEIIQYNVPDLPIKASRSSQEDYPSLSIVNHWHTEFEFIYVKNAPMWYSVNGEQCKLMPGQMIFVNSGQMHYGFWENPAIPSMTAPCFHRPLPPIPRPKICWRTSSTMRRRISFSTRRSPQKKQLSRW